MFLKEFAIRHYGPLPDSGRKKLAKFNLIYGPNEDGKTLTIDALLRLLFGKGALASFEAIKRVEENPEGFIIIEDSGEIKLPEAGTIPEIYGFSANEFGRIFIIRDSDLSINRENDFYRTMTARLTGIRTHEIEMIMTRLRELGKITPKGSLQNTDPYKYKERFSGVQALLEKIGPLSERLQSEGFSHIEEELARLNEERTAVNDKLNSYHAASRRELYEKGQMALERLKEAQKEEARLSTFKQEDFDSWQKAESATGHLNTEKLRLEADLDAVKKELVSVRILEKDLVLKKKKYERELNTAGEKLKPLLDENENLHRESSYSENLAENAIFKRGMVLVIALFFIALTGAIISPAWWLFVILTISALLTAAGTGLLFGHIGKQVRLKALEKEIFIEAAKLGFPADRLDDIDLAYTNLERLKAETSEELNEAEKELGWFQKENDRIRDSLEKTALRIGDEKDKINSFRQKLMLDSLDEFRTYLERGIRLKSEIRSQQSLLQSHFERTDNQAGVEPDYSYWEAKVEELSSYREAAPGLHYNQTDVDRLEAELTDNELKNGSLKEKQKEWIEELRDVEKEFNELMQFDLQDYLPCQTTVDLEVISEKLSSWLELQDLNLTASKLALSVFEELKEEEEKKVTTLFGADSPVSFYFNEITGGIYKEVCFEGGEYPLKVVTADGRNLDAYKLSGGAYDQLYFSIRLALGEKLLKGSRGFFILDDPFIKADPIRLKLLLNMLMDICQSGWQILYFSSKGEVREALKDRIEKGEVSEYSVGLSEK